MRFQIVYKASGDLEAFRKNLDDLGYRPEPIVSSRNPDVYTDNFKFELLPDVSVVVFPKGKFCLIQVGWNSVKEMKENEQRLMDFFGHEIITVLGKEYLILSLPKIVYDEDFLIELEASYSKCMKQGEAMEKRRKEHPSILDRLFFS